MELEDWWESGIGSNSYVTLTTKTGKLSVYLRRHIADKSVMMIASVSTISGYGGIRKLYRSATRDIPAIAENILNPDLDAILERWGWTHCYRDLAGIPSRVNPAFCERFPNYANARTAFEAIMLTRNEDRTALHPADA